MLTFIQFCCTIVCVNTNERIYLVMARIPVEGVPDEVKLRFSKKVEQEGTSMSRIIREWIINYITRDEKNREVA